MIPNRNKVEQPNIGYFTLEHEHAQRRIVQALQTSGNTVIVAADRPGLMAYYVACSSLSALKVMRGPKFGNCRLTATVFCKRSTSGLLILRWLK